MQEKWKPIEGYEDHYQISNHGQIWIEPKTHEFYSEAWGKHVTKEYDGKFGSPCDQGRGYLQFHLSRNDGSGGQEDPRLVHRLVMEHFGPDPPSEEHTFVNHIDGDKTNNRVDNLEWVTPTLNRLHESYLEAVQQHGEDTVRTKLKRWLSSGR
jgi:hypothetical protein